MRKINVFNFMSINGCFKGPNEDLSWHKHGGDESEFGINALKAGNTLLFGRKTYEMMAGYWPTPMAKQNSPEMAEGMNRAEKIVFSNTIKKANWENTNVMSGNIFEEMKKLKRGPGNDMTILGSGSIVTQFAGHGLIDEFSFMIDPVVLANGTHIFENVGKNIELKHLDTKTFKSGIVLLSFSVA